MLIRNAASMGVKGHIRRDEQRLGSFLREEDKAGQR
jgi:hypothetical protein